MMLNSSDLLAVRILEKTKKPIKIQSMKFLKAFLIGSVVLVMIAVGGWAIYMVGASHPAEAAVEPYLQSNETVTVVQDGWISFQPTGQTPSVGFIFYPGANVDHLAYAPPMHQIAAQGFLVVDVSMPLDLAVLSPNKAQDVIEAYPGIQTWIIGGHSLGGAMAARFIDTHPVSLAGLVLWAAYPSDSNSLADTNLPVLSIYGTKDGVSSPGKIERRFDLLPKDTLYLVLEGANHAQFGFYGTQNRDQAALISREEQQAQMIAATVDFLKSFEP